MELINIKNNNYYFMLIEDETISVNNRIIDIKDNIEKIESSIKKLEKCIKVGKQEEITDASLMPFYEKILELNKSKNILHGEIQNICNACKHDFSTIGTRKTLFGDEEIYQCKKCGYQITSFGL